MDYRASNTLKYFLILLYVYIETVCEDIKEDMKNIEADSKKIDCYAILDLFIHSFKCLLDSIKCCCFKIKIL